VNAQRDGIARIRLPDKLWKAKKWDGKQFVDVASDIFEQ